MTDKKITFSYALSALVAVVVTWIVHEFAHWSTSEMLGYEAVMRLNGTSAVGEQGPSGWHAVVISAAGPIITIVQAIFAFLILKPGKWNKHIYLFLFVAFYMRLMAGVMNVINPNDEGRISAFFGIGTFTLPLLVSGLLFYFVYRISKIYTIHWKFHLSTTLMVMVATSILILSDQYFVIRLI